MRLDPAAVEYVHFPVTTDATFTTAPSIAWDTTWTAAEWADPTWTPTGSGYTRTARQLIAGPLAASGDVGSAIVLAAGTYRPRLRFPDNPELVVRAAQEQLVIG